MKPPPIPADNSLARQVAGYCLLSPLVATGMSLALNATLHGPSESISKPVRAAFAAILCAILITGFIAGIVALCLMKPHGQRGILVRALTGLILNTLVIAMALTAIQDRGRLSERAKDRAQAAQQFQETLKHATEETRKELDGDQGAESPEGRVSDLQLSLQNLANKSSPNAAQILKAYSAYLERIREASDEHRKNVTLMNSAKILDVSGVRNKEDLEAKRVMLRAFLKSNEELKSFQANSDNVMREELVNAKVSPPQIESTMKSFQSQSQTMAGSVKIRDTDRQIGESMMAIIDLLDTSFGQWRFNHMNHELQFNKREVLDQYNGFIKEIQSAVTEQKRLQEQVLKMYQQGNTVQPGSEKEK
jgi:UPF0716 family protein affecting phage T7 exclusion